MPTAYIFFAMKKTKRQGGKSRRLTVAAFLEKLQDACNHGWRRKLKIWKGTHRKNSLRIYFKQPFDNGLVIKYCPIISVYVHTYKKCGVCSSSELFKSAQELGLSTQDTQTIIEASENDKPQSLEVRELREQMLKMQSRRPRRQHLQVDKAA
jgi:hypothetical protein